MTFLPAYVESFLTRFGLRVPIAMAPTGSIAGPELAIAVTNAGGMGALGLTWTPPEEVVAQVRQVRQMASGPFLVNFALAFPPHALAPALEAGAPIVSFSWGDPAPYLAQVRANRARWGMQVTNTSGAVYARELGADFLICQGIEAGGHVQASAPLSELLPRIADAAGDVPILAAGGLATGAHIAAVLRQGASAAMLGTRFVATRESRAHDIYKHKLVQAKGTDTALTVCFDGGWPQAPHRVLRNSTLERWEAVGCPPHGLRPGENEVTSTNAQGEPIYCYDDTAPRQGFSGDIEAMCLYAGTGCAAITDLPSASELIPRLRQECETALAER